MMLYLQSAVVMMDCLIVLSITSHTHKHNNNDANIITITNVWFAHASIPALTSADMEQTWEMLQHCPPPEKPMCKTK